MILIFEVCISDCPKSWSGLLAFAAARVLGIKDPAAILTFLVSAEMLFSAERGIVWAAEPHMDFFLSFIERAMDDVQLQQVKAAVHDYALRMGHFHSGGNRLLRG